MPPALGSIKQSSAGRKWEAGTAKRTAPPQGPRSSRMPAPCPHKSTLWDRPQAGLPAWAGRQG